MKTNVEDGLDIGWIESDAAHSGLPSGQCDVILSQHGYHYFPDKPAALEEFRRLLATGGRVGLSIWDGHSPYAQAVCAAVEQHISADELMAQFRRADFAEVAIQRQEIMIEVPLAEEFIPLHLGSVPIAGAFAALADNAKKAIVDHVSLALAGYADGERIIYPDAVHVVIGET